jgi:CheY-like chemotaxis protein
MPKLHCALLVDDDSTTNYLNRRLLEKLAVADMVRVARNGREALDVLASECSEPAPSCPVLIFVDINMPVMNGLEFLEAHQHLELPQKRVIIMLTTSLHPRDLQRLRALPVAGFLSKPLTAQKVEEVLQAHFAEA